MTSERLESLLRRDRAIVAAALAAVLLLAWLYLWHSAGSPAGGDMAMRHGGGMAEATPESRTGPWSAADFMLMAVMWAVMMVGMMTPSVAPIILLYARVARQANERGHAFAAAGWFGSGYLLAWIGFALAATTLQSLLEAGALLTPAMRIDHSVAAGALLVIAGLYQWTPLKHACLGRCRSPMHFIQDHGGFQPGRGASVLLGLKHGAYCIGCCWALMLLLFLGGVMNLLWVAALAALVLAEKLLPGGPILSRATGIALILAGAAIIAGLMPGWP